MELLKIFERYPFSRPCIALIIGIWVSNIFPYHSKIVWWGCIVIFFIITLSTFYPAKWSFRWVNGVNWILLFVSIGYLLLPPIATLPTSISDSRIEILATVLRQTSTKSGATQLVVNVEKCNDNDSILRDTKLLLTLVNQNKELCFANKLICFSTIIEPIFPTNNPGQFDYNSYLLTKGIYGRAFLNKFNIIESDIYSVSFFQLIASKANSWLKNTYINLGFRDDELGVMLALIDGDRSCISSDVKQGYQQTGTTHILAVSGLHVGVIMELLLLLFGWLDRYQLRLTKVVVIFSCLWVYAIISGLEASILRATIMFSILLVSRQLGRNVKLENSLFLSAFIILLIAPQSLFEAGFWLSYLAVASILLFAPKIEGLLNFSNYCGKKIWQLLAVTISAQIATLPCILFLFGTFPTYFLISNLLILPIVPIAMFGGIGVALLSYLTTNFLLANKLVIFTISYMNGVVEFLQKLPASLITGLNISFYFMIQIYILLILLLFYFDNRKIIYLYSAQVLLIIVLSVSAVNCWNKTRGYELVVFACKDIVATTKNGNKFCVYLSDLSKQNKNIADKYIHFTGKQKLQVDTIKCTRKLTPFFMEGNFGVIAANPDVLKQFSRLRYQPKYLIFNAVDGFSATSLPINFNTIIIGNKIPDGSFATSEVHFWNLSKFGAYIENVF